MATLFLLPAYLGETSPKNVFSEQEYALLKKLKYFIAENEKTARKFIKFLCPEIIQSELHFSIVDKRTSELEIKDITLPLAQGKDVGLISEAGLPCIADPGNKVVLWCHKNNLKVVPISGPSSIILTLISSGLNGQNFTFNGYLPIEQSERKKLIQNLELLSRKYDSSQIFMETPYRNQSLFKDLLKTLSPSTLLCIGINVTLPDENISTKSIKAWKKFEPDFHKKPAIFIIQAE